MRALLLISVLAFASCNPTGTSTPAGPTNNTAGTGFKRWVPDWKGGDTLTAVLIPPAGNPPNAPLYDTVYTDKVGDTTYIVYKGTRYYLFQYQNVVNVNEDTALRPQTYTYITFNTRPDTVGRPIKTIMGVRSSSYTTVSGTRAQKQFLSGCSEPFFPLVNAGAYFGSRTY